jgi:hypothetical protein
VPHPPPVATPAPASIVVPTADGLPGLAAHHSCRCFALIHGFSVGTWLSVAPFLGRRG